MKKIIAVLATVILSIGLVGCSASPSTENASSPSGSGETEVAEETTTDEATETEPEEPSEPEKPESQPISIGQSVQNDDFSITLTNARVDSVLQSDASSTYWEPQDGGAFVILEFDVTALNSNQLPVDDYAITNLVANYGEDVYQGWRLQYITNQLWLSFTHTYLDANIPVHVYAYTTVPSSALSEGSLSVDMTLAGTPYAIDIR